MEQKHDKKGKEEKTGEEGKIEVSEKWIKRSRHYTLWMGALFAVAAWLFLVIGWSDFLFRCQELSLYVPTAQFFHDFIIVPAGFLSYLGCFFTQFCYYPWLGALLLVVLWTLLFWVVVKSLHIPTRYASLALILVLLLVASDLGLGYWMLILKQQGYLFVATLGFLFLFLALWAARRLPFLYRVLLLVVWCVGGYLLLGFYALLGALCMALMVWKQPLGRNPKIIFSVIALLLIVAVPLAAYTVMPEFRQEDAYLMGWPPFDDRIVYDTTRFSLFVLMALFAVAASLLYREKPALDLPQRPVRNLWIQISFVALLVFVTQFWWEDDDNFFTEIKMTRAIDKGDWEEAVKASAAQKEEPSQLVVLYRNLALTKLGRVGDEAYNYPQGAARPKNMPMGLRVITLGGKLLYYHYGQFNFCYRWCMEDGVEMGWKVDYLKYMTKCSILSGEYDLAQRYIDMLKKTLFYHDWALRYEQFIKNPATIAKDPEFASILPLYIYIDLMVGENSTDIESYLPRFFGLSDPPKSTPLFDEVSLSSLLYAKQMGPIFGVAFMRYARSHPGKSLPIHYREAVMLSQYAQRGTIDHLTFIPDMERKQFMQMMQNLQGMKGMSTDKIAQAMYPMYGKSYYYYYFFFTPQSAETKKDE